MNSDKHTNASQKLPAGKLPHELLRTVLDRLPADDDRVLIGPGIGLDAAALQFGDRVLLAKSDPITFASEQQGRYAVLVNANDIACMGGEPRWLLATLLLPESAGATAGTLQHLLDDLAGTCREIGVAIVGGHTEITPTVTQPVIASMLLGEVARDRLLDLRSCRAGDRIVLVSGIAIEATALIAQHRAEELRPIFDEEFIQRCANFTRKPGISVLRAARLARKMRGAKAMHDPTEGGLATALHEIADACGCGLEIEGDAIIVLPEAKLLCDYYEIEVLGAIASGALLVVTEAARVAELLAAYEKHHFPAAEIGVLTPEPEHRVLRLGEQTLTLPRFDQDEIVKVL